MLDFAAEEIETHAVGLEVLTHYLGLLQVTIY